MKEIEKSSFQNIQRIPVQSFLRQLGIAFRKRNRQGFWLANEDQLEYLFVDLCRRVREIKVQLHPQRTGDAITFSKFVATADRVMQSFITRGVRIEGGTLAALRERETRSARIEHKRVVLGPAYQKRYRAEHRLELNASRRAWDRKRKAQALPAASSLATATQQRKKAAESDCVRG